MREAMGVTGYFDSGIVSGLSSIETIDLQPERAVADIYIRVRGEDVEEVREGGELDGLTLVQLILKDGASVETIHRVSASAEGLTAYHDPVLNRVRQEATAKKILL